MTWQDFYLVLATGSWIWLVFAFAFGACVGSLTNVLVYRLPLGLSVVSPPSRCPMCHTKLTWRENIPVFGWIFLRGRCRFCKSPISPEYPLVEAFVGVLFALFFVLWYTLPSHAHWLGVDWAMIRPDWAKWDATFDHWPHESWPMFIVLLVLVASLVAMSLVDLKTYTIPLQIPWFATIVALLFHVGYAAYITLRHQQDNFMPGNEFAWSLPTPANRFGQGNWWWIGASLGAMSGLLFANLALHFGWIRRSFSDYAEWEAQHLKKPTDDQHPAAPSAPEHPAAPVDYEWPSWIPRFASFSLVCTLTLVSFTVAGYFFSKHRGGPAWAGLLIGALVAPLVAALAVRPLIARAGKANSKSGGEAATAGPADSTPADDWILYPYARREMLKELVFLAPCIALAWLGGTLATNTGGTALIPLWLNVLTGVLMGYLIGGGVVWGARLFGSLAFGKEAMGLGDVHLMAAVGACTGWIDATLAFPLAAVVGLYWVIVHALAHRQMPRAMQFGPYLAVATVLVILGKPLVELGLTFLLKSDMPINLP